MPSESISTFQRLRRAKELLRKGESPASRNRTPVSRDSDRALAPGSGKGSRRDWKYLDPKELRRLRNLLFSARVIVEGVYSGRHRSPFKGASPEFVDYREYYPGDEIRTIDWKAYARTDRYFIKLFEKETDLDCYILLDRSASMGFGGPEYRDILGADTLSKFEYACYLSAALVYLTIRQGDKIGLTLFDEGPRRVIPPGGTFTRLYEILKVLERERPGRKTSISRVLQSSFRTFGRKGLLVVISDFLDDPEAIFAGLNPFRHRGFEILLLHVLHEFEWELPAVGNANFIDSETGEFLPAQPEDIREAYTTSIREFVRELEVGCRARRIDYRFMNTATPYHEVLERYLLRRSRL